MRYVSLLVTVPLTVFCLSFAMSNIRKVRVGLTPVGPEFELPLWLVGLGLMGIGFFCGALLLWLGTLRLRFSRRRALGQVARLEREMQRQQKQRLEEQARQALPPPG